MDGAPHAEWATGSTRSQPTMKDGAFALLLKTKEPILALTLSEKSSIFQVLFSVHSN